MTHFIKFTLTLIISLLWLISPIALSNEPQRILMIVSGHGKEAGKAAPGFEFSEFSKAYLLFRQQGFDVDVASPKGGKVVADEYDPATPFNAAVLRDTSAMAKLNDTLATGSLDSKDYQGIFIVGGKGAMFDLPEDSSLQTLIAQIYQQQGVVAAVCHGPAALVDVTLASGHSLLAGKRVNGFTNIEEQLFSKKWAKHYPFMLEDTLRARDGIFESSPMMLPHVTIDGRLITGQNPSSTIGVAVAMLDAMGHEVVLLPRYQEDQTLALIAQIIDGNANAAQRIVDTPSAYDIPLVGMYGYYFSKVADNRVESSHALTLMSIAQKQLNHPQIDLTIAQVQRQLGDQSGANQTLKNLLAQHPEFAPAKEMLENPE